MREDRALDLRTFVDWIAAGRLQAAPLLDEFLTIDGSSWEAWLQAHPEARTVQFFEGLLDAASRDSGRALGLTSFVLRHALSARTPPGAGLALIQLSGNAWRDQARALRRAGDAEGALRAYQTAAAIFSAEPTARDELEEVERETPAADGGGVAARLLAETAFDHWPSLALLPEMQHPGVLAELSREATARMDRTPAESLAIARLAVAIAEAGRVPRVLGSSVPREGGGPEDPRNRGTLPGDSIPRQALAKLQGRAWKDLGVALRHMARHDEALAALVRAEQAVEEYQALECDLASVCLARAAILQETNRFDESVAEVARSRPVFQKYDDRRRLVFCGIFDGALFHRRGRFREAVDLYLALLGDAETHCEPDVIAVIHNNIGHSAVGAGDYALAERHFDRAIAVFTKLDQPIHIARSELGRGRMMVQRGDVDRGIEHLQRVRSRFLEAQLVEEAGLAGLDIVEAHLARDAAGEAESLARQIIREFTAAGLNARAITALGYLGDAIGARRASAATVDNVRQFIRRLRTEPDAEFAATA